MAKKQVKNKTPSKRQEKYEVSGGILKRKQSFCPKCGHGIFLAVHKDRKTCGKCGYMEKISAHVKQ